jgi:hypothetical protein
MYLYSVKRGGGGVGLCGEHVQELYTVYFNQIPNPKLLYHPKQKPRRGGGPQTDENLPLSPFTSQFLRKADILDWSLLVIWSMPPSLL